jgi:hypothetical protein
MIRRFLVEAKIAPHSATRGLAVRNGARLIDNTGESILESFSSGAFENRGKGAAFLLDHDHYDEQRIGYVQSVLDNGVWHTADLIVELFHDDGAVPAILERLKPGTKVSPKFLTLEEDRSDGGENGVDVVRVTRARLEHVALLERGDIAGYQGAVITRVVELDAPTPPKRKPTTAAPAKTPNRPARAEGEVIITTGTIRRNCCTILRLR